jgi:hypothetical protein
MDLKMRLQRVLQILEDAERAGALSDLERDMVLSDLREAYAEVRFVGVTESVKEEVKAEPTPVVVPVVPVVPVAEPAVEPVAKPEPIDEDEEDEPEVEVELLFNEEEDDDEIEAEVESEPQEPITPVAPVTPTAPIETPAPVVEQPKEEPFIPRISPNPSSAILSLYEDEPAPVIGEQFHDKPSVADTIACPKGVAESTPVSSLRGAIGVADKFMLVRELFDGDAEAYERAIDALEQQRSFDDCLIYISENFAWRAQAEGTKFMMELLQRKYGEN